MSVETRCREAAKRLSSYGFVRIFSDDDADGIGAAGVLTAALARKGIPFHLTLTRLSPTDYASLDAHERVLLLDQGASEIERLSRHPGEVIVLDHHTTRGSGDRVLHVNPMLEGESGTSQCCTSSLALLTALHLDPMNADLAIVAMGGVVGDRQHIPQPQGTNAVLVQRATAAGTLSARRALPFEDEMPLDRALAASIDPFLAGLAGEGPKARRFVEELGLPPDGACGALTEPQVRKLTSAVVAHLLRQGVEGVLAEEAAGNRYYGRASGRDVSAARVASLFNACSRANAPATGVAVAHGDPEALAKAQGLVASYEEAVLKGLLRLERQPPTPLKAVQWFDAPAPEIAGAHCGLGMAYVFPKDKPALALSVQGNRLKVSGRATHTLVSQGVDLAAALHEAAREHGGNGGGHPIAAGASVPVAARDAFLARLDDIVGGQLHGGKTPA